MGGMTGRRYLAWFLGMVLAAVALMVAFNAIADAYVLSQPAGRSVQTVSGFERVLKPAWLDSVKPQVVFAGSSRMREGFDPALLDPALKARTFNYGLSSITAYEARRQIQDSAAQRSVRTIVMSMDAFSGGSAGQPVGSGFDELRLAVAADGSPTPRRALWLATTRYLSGGALGMHALSLYLMLGLRPGETAADRPDLFTAYDRMTEEGFRKDLVFRRDRKLVLTEWQRGEFDAALAAVCDRDLRAIFFFPPDHFAVIARYMTNDAAGLIAFKRAAIADVKRHNTSCRGKVSLLDFLYLNDVTGEDIGRDGSAGHLDLIHFRPPVGVRLARRMLGGSDELGVDLLARPEEADRLTRDLLRWREKH
jgi:hypothetical protein